MRGLGQRIEAEPVGFAHKPQRGLEAARDVLARLRLAPNNKPELEMFGHRKLTSSDGVFGIYQGCGRALLFVGGLFPGEASGLRLHGAHGVSRYINYH